jgi:hypothetical protein
MADSLDREVQQRLDKELLKGKPKGVTKGEYLYRGSTEKWKGGKYRKQAEAQEGKERKAYRKDDPNVKSGDAPIEGTKEEYVRRDQLALKMEDQKRGKVKYGKPPSRKAAARKR